MKIINELKAVLTAIGTGIGWLLGGFDTMMITLLIFMVIDYVSGVMCASKNKEISSKKGAEGIKKKVMILFLVAVGHLIGRAIDVEGVRYIVISFYLANEGISIIENASKLGLPVPKKIKDILEQLKTKSEDE